MSSSEDRTAGIAAQIRQWFSQGVWEAKSGLDVDRALRGIDETLEDEIDSTLSASTNYERIKERHGLVPKGEYEDFLRDMETRERRRFRDEIESQFDEYGIEAVVDAIAGTGTAPAALRERVDDVLDAADIPPDAYDLVLQDRIGELLAALGSDVAVTAADRLERLQAEARETREGPDPGDVRADVLAEFSRAFGQQFDSTAEAIDALRARLERDPAEPAADEEPEPEPSPADRRADDAIEVLER